jgi:hypothetical protein
MIANRTVAKTAAANKMATPFIKAPRIPRQESCPSLVVAWKCVRRCSNPPEISALLLIRDGPWSVGMSALYPLGDGDDTSRMPSHHPLAAQRFSGAASV